MAHFRYKGLIAIGVLFALIASSCIFKNPLTPRWSAEISEPEIATSAVFVAYPVIHLALLKNDGRVTIHSFDAESGSILKSHSATDGVEELCALADRFILTDREANTHFLIGDSNGDLKRSGSAVANPCKENELSTDVLGRLTLPWGAGELVIRRTPKDTQPSYEIHRDGMPVIDLGKHGVVPRQRGKFIVVPTPSKGVVLAHHTVDIETTAALINLNDNSLSPFPLSDLSVIIPSRGMAAGRQAAKITPTKQGSIIELLSARNSPTIIVNGSDVEELDVRRFRQSNLAVFKNGCYLAIVVHGDTGGLQIRNYSVCK